MFKYRVIQNEQLVIRSTRKIGVYSCTDG